MDSNPLTPLNHFCSVLKLLRTCPKDQPIHVYAHTHVKKILGNTAFIYSPSILYMLLLLQSLPYILLAFPGFIL